MNKKLLVIVAVIIVAIVGGVAFLMMQDKPTDTSSQDVVQQPTPPPTPDPMPPAEQPTPGSYKPYDPAVVASTKGTKILFFHASWCPQCRQLEAQLTTGPIPDNVTIFKVDYDTNQALRQKYGVQLQTTLVKIDDQGNMLQKFVAYDDPTLASLIKNML